MTSTTPRHSKATLWIWPTGLFPRRVVYYFAAKNITLSTLTAHNIDLIPVTMTPSGIAAQPGYEARPKGLTLPCMRLTREDGTVHWLHESLAIIGYLDEVFSNNSADGEHGTILGKSIEQRAKTRDFMSVFNEAVVWALSSLIHSDPHARAWSGLALADMSTVAAVDAKKRFDSCLSKLDEWVRGDVVGRGTRSLSGEGAEVTLADISLMAHVRYIADTYGAEWFERHEVLMGWCERARGERWCVGMEGLREAEEGRWEAALGA